MRDFILKNLDGFAQIETNGLPYPYLTNCYGRLVQRVSFKKELDKVRQELCVFYFMFFIDWFKNKRCVVKSPKELCVGHIIILGIERWT